MGKLTKEQVENVIINEGVVYINYGLEGQKLLGPCRGENSFEVDVEYRHMEMNGLKGKTEGTVRKIREDASLTVNLMDLSLDNLKMALPGSTITENKLSNGWTITSDDFIDNVVLIGDVNGGGKRKITIFRAMVDEPITLAFTNDDETVASVKFSAYYILESDELYEIEDVTELAE